MLTEEQEKAFESVVAMIRQKSREGSLVSMDEIREEMPNQEEETEEDEVPGIGLQALLTEQMKAHDDLRSIPDQEGRPRYYSSRFMSEAYAKILVRKEGEILVLIAETVREISSLSSRPVPVVTFSASPFHISSEELSVHLQKMAEDPQFQDIRQTVTSIGTCFLYSTRHLDPGRASMLSEWIDVGQHRNP